MAALYDEFGNYQGPELIDHGSDEDFDDEAVYSELAAAVEKQGASAAAAVPEEQRNYYPSAEQLYPGVEVLVEDEDRQPLSEPILAPIVEKDFDLVETQLPQTTFTYPFLHQMMDIRRDIRQVCVLGDFNVGKTSLVDLFVQQTHHSYKQNYADSRRDEQERKLSIKAAPLSLVLESSSEKSYLFHIFDTPGHPTLLDETCAALRICDGAVLVVDALMGLRPSGEKLLQLALREGLPLVLVVNGFDRLIIELRLTPSDAYHKLRLVIEDVNSAVSKASVVGNKSFRFSPARGNVCFASAKFEFVFSLESIARFYSREAANRERPGGWLRGLKGLLDAEIFARILWGDYYSNGRGGFTKEPPPGTSGERAFVEFVLTPLFKIFAQCLGEEPEKLQPLLEDVGIRLRANEYHECSPAELLRLALRAFFIDARALVDMILAQVPNPEAAALAKFRNTFVIDEECSRSDNPCAAAAMEGASKCNPDSDAVLVQIVKNYHRPDCSTFDSLGRVMAGTLRKGANVRILGEAYLRDHEDAEVRRISHLWIYQAGRYRIEVPTVPAGNWCLIGGISDCIYGSATVVGSNDVLIGAFKSLKFVSDAVVCVACEPAVPSDLPRLLEGLRSCRRAYPQCFTRVEESGEIVIFGTGELYLDCLLHDLRELYGRLQIRVSDPVVKLCETVVDGSSLKCSTRSANHQNKIYMLAEALESGLAEALESETFLGVETVPNLDEMGARCVEKFGWDELMAQSVWALGPDDRKGPSLLVNDTLPYEVDPKLLQAVKASIVQGFRWVAKEGPLIEETVRSVRFRLLGADLAQSTSQRPPGQIIPAVRRVSHAALLTATPRLMEPVYTVYVECPADCVTAVYEVLGKRRALVVSDAPIPGTPLFSATAYLPVLESFGFDTDLRIHTSGQAFAISMFDHWALVPGDPLDDTIVLRPLEPAPIPHLARELLLKTRRRKGLNAQIVVEKFFDAEMLA